MARVYEQQRGIRASPQLTGHSQDTTLLRPNVRAYLDEQSAPACCEPWIALHVGDLCANDVVNHCWKWRYCIPQGDGRRRGSLTPQTQLSQRGAVFGMHAPTARGCYLDFLLAERLAVRGVFIYLRCLAGCVFSRSILSEFLVSLNSK
jgi:hypothetical protein